MLEALQLCSLLLSRYHSHNMNQDHPLYCCDQASSGEDSCDVLYCHDGNRGAANWKGGASYFTVSDAIPVYYWPDNHGASILYSTAKHWLHRRLDYTSYCKDVLQDPNWNKARLSISGLIREPRTLGLFSKNAILAMKDVGPRVKGENYVH